MTRLVALAVLLFFGSYPTVAQDTLPRFNAVAKPMNRNQISWTNPYRFTAQISVQRSADSLRNFKTIVTVPDPTVSQNGFVDSRAPVGTNYYRLFVVLDSGRYFFTPSMRPAPDTSTSADPVLNDNQRVVVSDSIDIRELKVLEEKLKPKTGATRVEKFFVITRRDTVLYRLPEKSLKKFRDSLVYRTRDTLIFASVDTISVRPFIPKEIYKASKFVYTEKDGHVAIDLPDAGARKYSVRFFEEDQTPIFEIKEVLSRKLVVDKSNFIHSGWFWFELFEDGRLKERHRFFVPRDF